ncbi:MAG TPA: hypothetical protein VJN50_01720 [Actinomycetota bacterium]|nr:hypothetical protein [Actinomycetota bacterium]
MRRATVSLAAIVVVAMFATPAFANAGEQCPDGTDKFEVNGDATGGSWEWGGDGISVDVSGASATITLDAGVVIDSVCWKSGINEGPLGYATGPWVGPTTFTIQTNSGQYLSNIHFYRGEYPPDGYGPNAATSTSAPKDQSAVRLTWGIVLAVVATWALTRTLVRRRLETRKVEE